MLTDADDRSTVSRIDEVVFQCLLVQHFECTEAKNTLNPVYVAKWRTRIWNSDESTMCSSMCSDVLMDRKDAPCFSARSCGWNNVASLQQLGLLKTQDSANYSSRHLGMGFPRPALRACRYSQPRQFVWVRVSFPLWTDTSSIDSYLAIGVSVQASSWQSIYLWSRSHRWTSAIRLSHRMTTNGCHNCTHGGK